MTTLSSLAAALALAWSLVAGWLAIGAAIRRRRLERRSPAPAAPGAGVRVVLVRPCAGTEPGLAPCLASAVQARRSFELEVVFGVSRADDGAVPVIDDAVALLRSSGIPATRLVIAPIGPNRKASTIAGVVASSAPTPAVVINADSNIDLTGYDLDALVGPLCTDPGLGAVWAPFAEFASRPRLGTRACIAMLGGGLTAFPVLAALSPRSMSGKLWAIRVDAMEQAGGLGPLAEYLGEDFEMERRLRAAGFAVTAVPTTARAIAPDLGIRHAIARASRWMMVVRAQRPALLAAYPLLLASTPLNVALGVLGLGARPELAGPAIGHAVAARLLTAGTAAIASRRPLGPVTLVLDAILGDALILAAWIRTLGTRGVVWRGTALRVGRSGKLEVLRHV